MSAATGQVWRAGEDDVSLVPLSAVAQGDFVLGSARGHMAWLLVLQKVTLERREPVPMHSVFGANLLTGADILWNGEVVKVETISPSVLVRAPFVCHLAVAEAHAFVMIDNVLVSALRGM